MATYSDLIVKFPQMKEAIEAKGGTVTIANNNPSPDEIIAGIGTITPATKAPYQIVAAELPNVTFTLTKGETTIATKQTPATTGGIVTFDLNESGTYTLTASDSTGELWNSTVTIEDIGIYKAKSSKGGANRPLDNYTWEQLHTIQQGGYASVMFDVGDKKLFQDSNSIMNNYDIFITDIIKQIDGKEQIRWMVVNVLTSHNINPQYSYILTADATSFSTNGYSNYGGYKYSSMDMTMRAQGEEVYSQSTSIKPDDSTIENGIKFSEIYYSDINETSGVYTYDYQNDTFTLDTSFTPITSQYINNKFIKGYFKSVGTLTEEQFNAGHYYTYTNYIYTPATTYSSGTTYYGFYKTLQEDGVYLKALDSIKDYLVPIEIKAGTGYSGNYQYVSEMTRKVWLPAVEEIAGTNKDTILWGRQRESSTSPTGTSIYSYNIPNEGTKLPVFDDFQKQATGSWYWTRSSYSTGDSYFCRIYNDGSINGYNVASKIGVRVCFQTL